APDQPAIVLRHAKRRRLDAELAHHLAERSFDRLAADNRRYRDHRALRSAQRVSDPRQCKNRVDADEWIGGRDDDSLRAAKRIAKTGARCGALAALKPHAAKHRLALPPHEIILEIECAFVGLDNAA